MRILVLAAVLAVLAVEPADACTISREPAASVFQPASGKAPGLPRQLWVAIADGDGHVGPAIKI